MDTECHRCGKETIDLVPCPYYNMNGEDEYTESGPWCCDIDCSGDCAMEV